MLDFGFSEILLTSAIALVVLGPERLPKVAKQVGNWMGRARLMARQLSEQLEREVNAEELLREQAKPRIASIDPALNAPLPADHTVPGAIESAPPVQAPHPTSAQAMHPAAPPTPTSVDPQQTSQ